MPKHPLRVHLQNDATDVPAMQLTSAQLLAAASLRHGLAGRLKVTEDGGGTHLPPALADAEVLFAGLKLPLDEVRQLAPGLRWVQVTYAGVEKLLPHTPADLLLTNASGVHAEKGGEFVLAATLMLAYRIPQFVTDQQARRWQPVYAPVLRRCRVTMLGVGAIGGAAAAALRERGCVVTGVTRSGRSEASLDGVVDPDGLDELLQRTDILVSTLPLTAETRGMIDRRRIGLLPEGAGVIVVGRAAVLDYEALFDRLDAGTLGGAVLDVFMTEPAAPDDRVWRTPRLIMTRHCSVDDHSVYMERCLEIFLDNLERYIEGRPLRNLVEPARGY